MNKYYLDGVLVVEGIQDVGFISTFITTQFFTTNGSDISDEKIEFLSRVADVNRVIVLTDNDEAGQRISNKIKSKINKVFVVKTPEIYRKSTKKHGVAETDKKEIIDSLREFLQEDRGQFQRIDYGLNKLISLSKNPSNQKNYIIQQYRLLNGNNKYLEKQLQMLGIKKEEIVAKYGN